MVSTPGDDWDTDASAPPLSQLLLNSHSPVVLSALINSDHQAVDGLVLFADTSTVSDPQMGEVRRRTRLRPVKAQFQRALFDEGELRQGFVSDYEVARVLDTVSAEG